MSVFLPGHNKSDNKNMETSGEGLFVSVIISAYNEEKVIRKRIENILNIDYPRDLMEIIIVSDGSSDRTADIAHQYRNRGVITIDMKRSGKAIAQNRGVARAGGDIIVFTDADSSFDHRFIRAIVRRFRENPEAGCVIGNLEWKEGASAVARLRKSLWKIETDLRSTESRLGILAGGTGAGMAVLRRLWKPMEHSTDDTDSITPLDVIKQGYKVVFASDAIVSDVSFTQVKSEFNAKVRGVSKTLVMVFNRWSFRDWVRHPLITLRMASHHFLRWLLVFIIVPVIIGSFFLFNEGLFYQALLFCEILAGVSIVIGIIAEHLNRHLFLISTLYSFAAINAGMAVGFMKAITGRVKGPWETE